MFSSLRSKLALLYAALFGAILTALMVAAYFAIQGNAIRTVRTEMQANAAVFERLWEAREAEIANAAGVLSRDFGFRAAVATQDMPTLESALMNIGNRFQFDTAFVIDLDGTVIGLEASQLPLRGDAILDMLYAQSGNGGVLDISGRPVHAVITPIEAPALVGWVVFGEVISANQLDSVAGLSSLPLGTQMRWWEDGRGWSSTNPNGIAQTALEMTSNVAVISPPDGERSLVSSVPINSLRTGLEAVLVLDYPLSEALAPYRAIFVSILVVGMGGLLIMMAGTWHLASQITRPIGRLDAAARQLSRGERPQIIVRGRDELARLADSFNRMSHDILEREERITHLALHDDQTGLPNMKALLQEIERLTGLETRHGYVAAISIDRFESIRGAIGFEPAAALLSLLAERLQTIDPQMILGRTATDSLGAVFQAASPEDAIMRARQLTELANAPVSLLGDTIDIHAVVGWLHIADTGQSGLGPMECAGVAVDQARARRCRTAAYDADAYGDPGSTLSMMSRLISGLSSGDVYLEHQPKLDIRSREITGVETLLRWADPVSGPVSPDVFIERAEETGHIAPITDWVLQQVISEQNRLREAGHDLLFSLNISGRLLTDSRFVDSALKALSESSARLCFEITETAVIDDPETALESMNAFRDAGVMISIDDYGEGLSSLSYVRSMPAGELKIDKSFILKLDQRENDALLVKSTIDLAHSLGMKVTAEGVENAMSLAILGTMGADLAQGYYISRPLRYDRLVGFLEDWKAENQALPDAPTRRTAN